GARRRGRDRERPARPGLRRSGAGPAHPPRPARRGRLRWAVRGDAPVPALARPPRRRPGKGQGGPLGVRERQHRVLPRRVVPTARGPAGHAGHPAMRWIYPLAPETEQGPEVLGGKAHGLVMLGRLRLPVPPGFVIGTEACRAFLRPRRFPDGLDDELAAAVGELEATTGRRLGGPERPLAVSVRSGASVSMPGMMTTILNLGVTSGFA